MSRRQVYSLCLMLLGLLVMLLGGMVVYNVLDSLNTGDPINPRLVLTAALTLLQVGAMIARLGVHEL